MPHLDHDLEKGLANGIATLDGSGTVPAAQLPQATETAIGAAEIATQAETDAGVDDTRFVTPLKLKNFSGLTTSDLPAVSIRRTTSFTGSSTYADVTFNVTDIENNTAILEHDNTNTDRILIKETGLYQVGYSVEILPTGTPSSLDGRVRINDTTVIPNSQSMVQEDNEITNFNSIFLVELTASDYITLQVQTSVGTETVQAGATFFVMKAQGIKGDPGPTGSGSTLIIRDEGVNVTNTPHSILDFAGDNVSVADAGSGRAVVTVDVPVFGQDYQTAISLARSTTTSTTFQTKVTLTTPTLTGTYRVGWVSVIDHNNTGDSTEVRLQNITDGVTVGVIRRVEPKDVDDRVTEGGFAEVVFTGAAKTFEIQWREQDGTTAGIQDARIEIWRVA